MLPLSLLHSPLGARKHSTDKFPTGQIPLVPLSPTYPNLPLLRHFGHFFSCLLLRSFQSSLGTTVVVTPNPAPKSMVISVLSARATDSPPAWRGRHPQLFVRQPCQPPRTFATLALGAFDLFPCILYAPPALRSAARVRGSLTVKSEGAVTPRRNAFLT
jgi:hypothetical protein